MADECRVYHWEQISLSLNELGYLDATDGDSMPTAYGSK